MTKNEIKILYRFLKELTIYSQFIKLTDKNFNFHYYKSLKEYFKAKRRSNVFDYAFLWSATPQGKLFWTRINDCWKREGGIITDQLRDDLKRLDMSKTFK